MISLFGMAAASRAPAWTHRGTETQGKPMAIRETAQKLDFPTGVSLGRAIRALRAERGLSLSQLAVVAGLDKGYLSRVERGLKVPSVAIILRISTALEVSAAQLFGAAENHELIFVTRAGARDEMSADDGNYHMRLLTQSDSASAMEVFLMHPPAELPGEPEAEHRGEELLYVVEGRVEITFPERELILEKGDSVQFPGPLRHQVRRLEENSCVLIAVSGS
tara:strand:+ start:2614 stop:3276 length:663 start_codon:yes stop_codon:yes gene_type:complete